MAKIDVKNKSITSRDEDFAQWYTDVCKKAELMDYYQTKGFIIYRPYGYAIWENIKNYLDEKFKATGHSNVYMPMVIPTSLFQKEKDHIEGFAPETLVATIGGSQEIQDPLIIRPTSECVFTDHFSHIISSYRDLPVKYNQWCSVVRWEKTTRPFLRGSEFLWQEGHTMHASEVEAREETLKMLEIYDSLGKDLLAIPFVKGRKTEKEKFAGAEETYSIEALMHDGKALQSGTSHYFGQGFAKAFDVKYLDKDGKIKNPYQTSWGASTRLIGAIIMVHGDDNGLVLPPFVAPIQTVIVPIQMAKEGVLAKCREIFTKLKEAGNVQLVLINHGQKESQQIFAQKITNAEFTKRVEILSEHSAVVGKFGLIKIMGSKIYSVKMPKEDNSTEKYKKEGRIPVRKRFNNYFVCKSR